MAIFNYNPLIKILTSPSVRAATSSLTTSNSPLKSASFSFSISYLSMRKTSRLMPGTVSMSPSYEADNWNSLNKQAETQPVVERERPTLEKFNNEYELLSSIVEDNLEDLPICILLKNSWTLSSFQALLSAIDNC